MDHGLAAAYAHCRQLHRRHGRTYYLATRLLPAWKRPHVHALYGFTRHADDIVDAIDGLPGAERAEKLRDWSDRFLAGLAGATLDDPIIPAVVHTITAFDLDRNDFASFLKSMAMDLDTTRYATYDELLGYMEGSAAVIGTMMVPILQGTNLVTAREPARQLGLAFQLTNFIRDIGEDLDRGRIYLPGTDLDRFGVTEADLRAAADRRNASPAVRDLIRHEVRRAQEHYLAAAPGITMLTGTSQSCIRTAYHLYGGILDEIATAGYDPFVRRAVVPTRRRIQVAQRCLRTPAGTPVLRAPGPTLEVAR